jgi:hypothetical protein
MVNLLQITLLDILPGILFLRYGDLLTNGLLKYLPLDDRKHPPYRACTPDSKALTADWNLAVCEYTTTTLL